MKKLIKKMVGEAFSGKNLDIYFGIILSLGVAIYGLFPDIKESFVFAAILMTLADVLAGFLQNRWSMEEMRKSIDEIQPAKKGIEIRKWDDREFKQRLQTAKEVRLLAVAPSQFIDSNAEGFSALIARGGHLSCCLLSPKGNAIEMAAERGFGAGVRVDYVKNQIKLALQKLQEFAKITGDNRSVQIKIIDHLPSSVLTILDADSPDGLMFVTNRGFGLALAASPSFILSKEKNLEWFEYYKNTFDNIWKSNGCVEVDLDNIEQYF